MGSLLQLILYLLVAGILIYVVQLVLGMLAIPQQIKTIILIIIGLVFLIFILRVLGIFIF